MGDVRSLFIANKCGESAWIIKIFGGLNSLLPSAFIGLSTVYRYDGFGDGVSTKTGGDADNTAIDLNDALVRVY